MKLLSTITIATVLLILYLPELEGWILTSGASWSFSKAAPYLLLVLSGSLSSLATARLVKRIKYKKLILLSIFTLPFSIGFLFHPIYEGDFSLNGETVAKNLSPLDFTEDGITVIAIPNCPYCFQSIRRLKRLKKRKPNLSIQFIVCTSDTLLLTKYKKEIANSFTIKMANNSIELAKMAKLFFPSFLQVINKQPTYYWSNDQFGVRAIDKIEKTF
jgi:hypothetical protein